MRKPIPKLIIYLNNTILIPTIGEINPDYPDSDFKPTCLTGRRSDTLRPFWPLLFLTFL